MYVCYYCPSRLYRKHTLYKIQSLSIVGSKKGRTLAEPYLILYLTSHHTLPFYTHQYPQTTYNQSTPQSAPGSRVGYYSTPMRSPMECESAELRQSTKDVNSLYPDYIL
jgi:hypothetical protein